MSTPSTSDGMPGNIVSEHTLRLDGPDWLLAVDPGNVGRREEWWREPRADAARVHVPGLIQDQFPDYRGVVWYWTEFEAPENPHADGRYLLHVREIDYLADVWVNDQAIGSHEGAQEPFTLDATRAIRPGETNRLAVRLLHPTNEPIDGFTYGETPHGLASLVSIVGGIMDSVELLVTPSVHVEDLYVQPDWVTGGIHVQARVRNYGATDRAVRMLATVSPAVGGEILDTRGWEQMLPPGESLLETSLSVDRHRLWELNDPFLYRVAVQATVEGSSLAGMSTRCGFRDLRFEDGYFRLNGRRIFLKNSHHGASAPAWGLIPSDPDFLRRDLLNVKSMGFNMLRFIARAPQPYVLDLADEIGLLIYEEHYAAWVFANSPKMPERFDHALSAVIRRDRNHASVVIWGLLNETGDPQICQHAVDSLPLVRRLDPGRMVMLHSGRFDSAGNYVNGLQIWSPTDRVEPNAIYNPKPNGIAHSVLWPSHSLSLNAGFEGEYAALRFTVPRNGAYRVKAVFRGTAPFTKADVHVLHNGRAVYDGFINLHARGDLCVHEEQLALRRGETVDFVMGLADGHEYGGWFGSQWVDNTQVAVTVQSERGEQFDAAAEFSFVQNPNGPWSYGYMPAGPSPLAAGFVAFDTSQTEDIPCAGGISNPGSDEWVDVVSDQHHYPRVPHRELEISRLRTMSGNDNPLYLSEYGVGSGVHVIRLLRHYEQLGKPDCYNARALKAKEEAFLEVWQRWRLDDAFAGPSDFFEKCLARMAGLRKLGINALRSNPKTVAYSLTMCHDPHIYGEGVMTSFREPKPGAFDAVFDGFYPLRWCLFAEPAHVYSGTSVRFEAVLANEDRLAPGEYPARFRIVDPDNRELLDERRTVTVPAVDDAEPPYAVPVFEQDVVVDGPSGRYRFFAEFEKGAAAAGGDIEFCVMNDEDMPVVRAGVALWSDDPELEGWLSAHGVEVSRFGRHAVARGNVILISNGPAGGNTEGKWRDLKAAIAGGATAIFLDPGVFAKGDEPLGWLPLETKGTTDRVYEYTFPQVYPKDEWAKAHPIFAGLPADGLMDYAFYREIIPDWRYIGQETPAEAVAGAFRTSAGGVQSELMVAVYELGAGRLVLNSLRVRQALGSDPVAERLLRNMINYADGHAD